MVNRILGAIIAFHGKKIVLEASSSLISDTNKGKAKRRKPTIPKASGRNVRSNVHVSKGKSFQYNKEGYWKGNCVRCLNSLKNGSRGTICL